MPLSCQKKQMPLIVNAMSFVHPSPATKLIGRLIIRRSESSFSAICCSCPLYPLDEKLLSMFDCSTRARKCNRILTVTMGGPETDTWENVCKEAFTWSWDHLTKIRELGKSKLTMNVSCFFPNVFPVITALIPLKVGFGLWLYNQSNSYSASVYFKYLPIISTVAGTLAFIVVLDVLDSYFRLLIYISLERKKCQD